VLNTARPKDTKVSNVTSTRLQREVNILDVIPLPEHTGTLGEEMLYLPYSSFPKSDCGPKKNTEKKLQIKI
jgi:hypothetical protein